MAMHDDGDIGAYAYAGLLITIHVLFIIIYLFRVKFTSLDNSRYGFWSRVLGLVFCAMLLGLVSDSLDKNDLGLLAVKLIGLIAVHLLILLFLSIKVNSLNVSGSIEDASVRTKSF